MSHFTTPITCEQFEASVSDYVDHALSGSDGAAMDAHLARCAACTALHAEVAAIVADAGQLPLLNPSRDLWSGIAERLDTPVVSIGTTGSHPVRAKRTVSYQLFAAAAMLIVAVSAGSTYLLTRANAVEHVTTPVASNQPALTPSNPGTAALATPTAVSPTTTPRDPASRGAALASVTPNSRTQTADAGEPSRSRYASNDGSVELVYERQITEMRRIVDDRLGDLDSTTVVEIERNLRIIDKAISDSRRALQNDPRSRFLSSQLDRALETKLGVLRRIALL